MSIGGNLTMAQTKTIVPSHPAPLCQIQRQGLQPATGIRGTASTVCPRGFRGCLLVFVLPRACIFSVHSGIKSKTKAPQLSPQTNQGSLRLLLSQACVAARSAAKAVQYLGQRAIQSWASKPSAASLHCMWSEHPVAHRVNTVKQVSQ